MGEGRRKHVFQFTDRKNGYARCWCGNTCTATAHNGYSADESLNAASCNHDSACEVLAAPNAPNESEQ